MPAWWLLKKKKTMYHTGGGDARSVRSLMQFMMSPLNSGPAIIKEEADFRDIQAYLLSLEPPKYPFPIDATLAKKGQELFEATCSRCHGTYGEKWTYPNKIVPLEEIGTDPNALRGHHAEGSATTTTRAGSPRRRATTATRPMPTDGYQAPPLDGIWATAPYFHNGSVPTVYHVLNSKARPKIFTRSYRTDEADYDEEKLGWKVKVLDGPPDPKLPPIERRKVYDTTQPGRGNGGHTFGDKLTEERAHGGDRVSEDAVVRLRLRPPPSSPCPRSRRGGRRTPCNRARQVGVGQREGQQRWQKTSVSSSSASGLVGPTASATARAWMRARIRACTVATSATPGAPRQLLEVDAIGVRADFAGLERRSAVDAPRRGRRCWRPASGRCTAMTRSARPRSAAASVSRWRQVS